MASAAQAQRDLSLLIPTPVERPRAREFESPVEEVRGLMAVTINRMIEIANRHGADLPSINADRMTVTQPREGVLFIQSGGHIFSFNADRGTLSVDGKPILG